MKKIFMLLALLIIGFGFTHAQILRAEELEKYAKEKYGEKWVEAAENLSSQITLDKNNALTYVQVIQADGKTKDQLYVLLNYWFTSTFNDGKSVIQLNDKEIGSIIAKGFVEGIANHSGGMNTYVVNLEPIIKCDIKEGKVRVSYTVPFYTVMKLVGGGFLGNAAKAVRSNENWVLDKCYPFAQKDSHKKTSCKALIMAHAYSNVIIDKIEECIKNGLLGNENDNW